MNIFFINKKKLGVTIIIIGLMVVLFALEKSFDEKLKLTSLIQNNINILKQYEIFNGDISYKLPDKWIVEEKKIPGGEILYHNEFQSEDAKIHGFVQVWNIYGGLKGFLEKSKAIASKQNLIDNYSISDIYVDARKGYMVNYNMVTNSDQTYKSYEYFIENGDKVVRFSFFVRKENFKENMPLIFKSIVKTMSIN